jgi:alanine racemase
MKRPMFSAAHVVACVAIGVIDGVQRQQSGRADTAREHCVASCSGNVCTCA